MTREVVRDLGWLDDFGNVTVTEYLYDDASINQIKIRYFNNESMELGPSDFYYHALYEPVLFFKGAKVGSQMTARQILTDFSDEPDWEMDQNLDLSWMQVFHGESQGYRHMYYPGLTFHLPMGFYPQGKTPERVEHFYQLSKEAFKKNDTYWGFRFLARAMHYVQDMAQPYHSRQLYWRFIDLTDPYYGTVQTIKNYHFAYESYESNLFRLEEQGVMPRLLSNALRYSLPVEVRDTEQLVNYVARRGYWHSSHTMSISYQFLGEKYKSASAVPMTKEDFFQKIQQQDKIADLYHDDLEQRVLLFGKATKSFLEFARKDLDLDSYMQ